MKYYTVTRGDNLSKIARRHGLRSWRDLYFNPGNAGFRAKRPNPDLIHPGDRLVVPQPQQVSRSAPTRSRKKPSDTNQRTADEVGLKQAAAKTAAETIGKDPELIGFPSLSQVTGFLAKLHAQSVEQLKREGVQAFLFGKAFVRKPGYRADWDTDWGLRPKVVDKGRKETHHEGTKLYRNYRVETIDSSGAVLVFLDLSTVRMRKNLVVIIYGSSDRRARRAIQPAVLEKGTLRDRLKDLDGTR